MRQVEIIYEVFIIIRTIPVVNFNESYFIHDAGGRVGVHLFVHI